jgi:multidrug efflux pump subunit AcrB
MGQLDRASRNDPSALERLYVRADNGQMVPLSAVATVREFTGPAALYRYDRYVAATVSAGLNPGYALGDGIKAMREIAAASCPRGSPPRSPASRATSRKARAVYSTRSCSRWR